MSGCSTSCSGRRSCRRAEVGARQYVVELESGTIRLTPAPPGLPRISSCVGKIILMGRRVGWPEGVLGSWEGTSLPFPERK